MQSPSNNLDLDPASWNSFSHGDGMGVPFVYKTIPISSPGIVAGMECWLAYPVMLYDGDGNEPYGYMDGDGEGNPDYLLIHDPQHEHPDYGN